MNRYIKYVSFILLTILFAGCADEETRMPEQPDPDTPAPEVVSKNPVDGTRKIVAGATPIQIVYNQPIKLVNLNHGIKINGEKVYSADAIGSTLKIVAMTQEDTQYTVTVPAGIVGNSVEKTAGEASVTFETVSRTIATNLVNPNATEQAKKLYTYLREKIARMQTLSGVMADVSWNYDNAKQVHEWTGKWPAINTFDYVHLQVSPADWINYEDITPVKEWWTAGGIVSAMWHWNVPKSAPAVEIELWKADPVATGNWENVLKIEGESISIFESLVVGNFIKVTAADIQEGAQGSLKSPAEGWPAIADGYEYFDITGDYEMEVTQEILDELKTNGLIVGGQKYTITGISKVVRGEAGYDFYKEGTVFDAENATTPGTWENEVFTADLEKMAGMLQLLQNEGIPVLWRPFHEAAGGWFWWGKDAESFKKLWITMFDYFKSQNINNLIWVYTAEPNDSDWFPGDEYVDIIGRDLYDKDAEACADEYDALNDRQYSEYIIALTECGTVGNITEQWKKGARWAWFMPWYGEVEKDVPHADKDWWVDAFSQEFVVDRDNVPNLK